MFVIVELGSRRIVHYAVTRSPTDAWVAQQLRNATPFGNRPRYLIRDNDSKYGPSFARAAAGIEVLRTPYRAPRANAICERFLGSLRRECLDHILVLGEDHVRRTLKEYTGYFNHARPHQGIGQAGGTFRFEQPHDPVPDRVADLAGLIDDWQARVQPHPSVPDLDAPEEAIVEKRLQDLGYF